ncbi:hypothetical protein [Vibrio sp. B181a]|uniref:hypothetical protein n=1 Tax=Vibrio sp. B181a TaxID=2835906 RepID=UPI0025572539|nr:hypothetical protein [Vibrio sp. B181a]MDK9773330.1 hypothetical protein [Vibrio sp. B181a]
MLSERYSKALQALKKNTANFVHYDRKTLALGQNEMANYQSECEQIVKLALENGVPVADLNEEILVQWLALGKQ